MSDSKIPQIQGILSEVDALLRERLKALGVETAHLLLVVAPDGAGIVRGNVGKEGLGDMAEMLAEAASGATLRRPEDEPLN